MNKIEELVNQLEGTESIEFSKTDNGYRLDLHLTNWYKPIYGTTVNDCIKDGINFIKENCHDKN